MAWPEGVARRERRTPSRCSGQNGRRENAPWATVWSPLCDPAESSLHRGGAGVTV